MNNINELNQHFMIDEKIIKKMVKHIKPKKKEIILEIGAGAGSLTKELAKKAKVIAVEIDNKFVDALQKTKADVINANVLQMKLPKADKIVGNLPYNAIEPLIWKLITADFKEATFTITKNFLTKENKMNYVLNNYFKVKVLGEIKKEAFEPAPKVDSAIIQLKKSVYKTKSKLITKEMLEQNDKKIKNALREALIRVKVVKTKNEARALIKKLKADSIEEKNITQLSSKEFFELIKKLEVLK